jgi:hypothetical protein
MLDSSSFAIATEDRRYSKEKICVPDRKVLGSSIRYEEILALKISAVWIELKGDSKDKKCGGQTSNTVLNVITIKSKKA